MNKFNSLEIVTAEATLTRKTSEKVYCHFEPLPRWSAACLRGDSDEVDQHSALMPIGVPGGSDQSSERSDAGFCILLKVIAIVKLVVVEAV